MTASEVLPSPPALSKACRTTLSGTTSARIGEQDGRAHEPGEPGLGERVDGGDVLDVAEVGHQDEADAGAADQGAQGGEAVGLAAAVVDEDAVQVEAFEHGEVGQGPAQPDLGVRGVQEGQRDVPVSGPV